MSRKRQKVSQECSPIIDFCYRSSSEKVLSDLPDEILIKICEYLTPQSLAQISNLRIQRLTAAACFKSADFSACNTINLKDLQWFFIEERLNLIQEINFNNVFYALPSALTAFILKCQNITKLYVYNCGLDFSHIGNIFNNCKALLECYWCVPDKEEGYARNHPPCGISNSLKKFCLQTQFYPSVGNDLTVLSFIGMCPNVEELTLNYTPCYITSVPAHLSTKYFCFKSITKRQKIAINIVLTCSDRMNLYNHRVSLFMQGINILKHSQEIMNTGENSDPSYLIRHSALVQLFTQKEFLDELPQVPDESVDSLVIIMNENYHTIFEHLNKFIKMTGKALNHLSVCKNENSIPTTVDPSEYLRISSILSDIIACSVNITVLNLSELHMDHVFPLPNGSILKHLKVFNISACCLAVPVTECVESIADGQAARNGRQFRDLVLNCKKVEEFGVYGCTLCSLGPTDEDLCPISSWKELKCLTLERVKTVRQCRFLIQVAKMCPKLKMVELILLNEPKVCHFIPSLIHILKESKELFFLRINQPGFYPMDSLFWKSIESATNLQGLCLSTAVSTFIESKPILEVLKKLPYIHLFHLLAKGSCENLKTHVKRIMCSTKGVKIPNIKVSNSYSEPFEPCCKRHYAMI